MERLFDKLQAYGKSSFYPYHMPGHKRRPFTGIPEQLAQMDITEIEGFDNLHDPKEILKELQEKAAALYGAEESFFMVNGSTGGILSAVSAAVPEGGHILMARNCHKSAYHAAYLRNIKISYLYPGLMKEYDIYEAVTPQQIERELDKGQDVNAVLIVSPTYEGRIADVCAIARVVHERGIPLIVDEAHGSHLGFDRHLAKNSCMCGADIVIHSLHKTMPALTQAALLHVNGALVDRERLKRFLHIYQTSSPSYLLMASIDNALNCAERWRGKRFFQFTLKYRQMLERLSECRHLQFIPPAAEKQDFGKLVISLKKTKLSGQELYDILLQEEQLQLEMACSNYCLAMFTVCDEDEAYERMTKALIKVDSELDSMETGKRFEGRYEFHADHSNEENAALSSIPLCQAWDRETELLAMEQAAGRLAGDFIHLYPPGVPILVPGEKICREIVLLLAEYLKQGLNVQGVIRLQEAYYIRVLV